MGKNIVIDAGHGYYTAGKRCLQKLDANQTREWWLNDRIADKVEQLLTGFENVNVLSLRAEGLNYVILGGEIVVEDAVHNGKRNGKVILR